MVELLTLRLLSAFLVGYVGWDLVFTVLKKFLVLLRNFLDHHRTFISECDRHFRQKVTCNTTISQKSLFSLTLSVKLPLLILCLFLPQSVV